MAQRTLMLQTISFLVWQHLWSLAYSHIEGWQYLDTVYWADFTSLTIGIGGSYVPKTHLGRSLLFPFALGGVVILGLLVGSIRSLVLDRGKQKVESRMTEKTRQRLVHRVAIAIEKEDGAPKRKFNFLHIHKINKNIRQALVVEPGSGVMPEKTRRHYEFEAMRRIQYVASARRRYLALCISAFAFAFLWFMGAFVFYEAEYEQQWTYFDCIYFSYTSLLTIGYGDFEPMSPAGKSFFVFWSLLAIPTLTILISNMGDTVVKWVKDVTIWIGEVTVLPSDEASVLDRLRYGVLTAIFGKKTAQQKHQERMSEKGEEGSKDTEAGENVEQPPGRMLGLKALRNKREKKRDKAVNARLADDFAKHEANDEEEAKRSGNTIAADEHHLRCQLLQEIRKVYADSLQPEDKQYTYKEWAYYIKLLGQDEGNSKYHIQPNEADDAPGSHSHEDKENKDPDSPKTPKRASTYPDTGRGPLPDPESIQWSWIGQKSPLMNEKSEPEWLLNRLFRKLEGSLEKQLPPNPKDGEKKKEDDDDDEQRNRSASSGTRAESPRSMTTARQTSNDDSEMWQRKNGGEQAGTKEEDYVDAKDMEGN